MVLREADNPELAEQRGNDIITASGLTLLGSDDKSGVAEIMAAAEYLMTHPDIPHGAGQDRLHAGRGNRPRHAVFRREPLRRAVRVHARRPEARRARDRKLLGRCDDDDLQGLQRASRLREGAHGQRHQAGVRVRASPAAQRALARDDRRLRRLRASATAYRAASSAPSSSCCCATSPRRDSTRRRGC